MFIKAGLLFVVLLVGGNALPTKEQDMSIFFDHTDPSSRIVGGTVAGPTPHAVALQTGTLIRSLLCGGSLISNTRVLTAAHCTVAASIGSILLASLRGRIGSNQWGSGGVEYAFSRHITHANYMSNVIKNDISVLVTSTNVVFTNTIQPVALNFDWIPAGVSTSVTGWGRTVAGGAISPVLLQLTATVVDGSTCAAWVAQQGALLGIWNMPPVDPNVELCTFQATGQGACNGDSGSALVLVVNGRQVGIVSWGIPCARGAPDMFVRVSAFQSWLQTAMVS